MIRVLAASLLSLCGVSEAKEPIYLDTNPQSRIGIKLVYELQEEIRRSETLRLAGNEDDGFQQVRLLVVDDGQRAIYSMVRTIKIAPGTHAYLAQFVGTCLESEIEKCSRSLVLGIAQGVAVDQKIMEEERVKLERERADK